MKRGIQTAGEEGIYMLSSQCTHLMIETTLHLAACSRVAILVKDAACADQRGLSTRRSYFWNKRILMLARFTAPVVST